MSRALGGVLVASPAVSGGSEAKFETRPAGSVVAHGNAGAMCPDDLHDDRQSEPRALGSDPSTTPETIENARSVLDRDARSTVQNSQRAIPADINDHLSPNRRMRQRIFDEIAQRVANRGSITGND